jgi:replicative DNA helicase
LKAVVAPPHNLEAEVAVLGSLFQRDVDALRLVLERACAENFYRPAHQEVFRACRTVAERLGPEAVDVVTVSEALLVRGVLAAIGGDAYLTTLCDSVGTTANIAHHLDIVLEKASLRRLLEAGEYLQELVLGNGQPAAAIRQQIRETLLPLTEEPRTWTAIGGAEDSTTFLAGDVPEVAWRIDGLWPEGSSGFIAGPEKAGKGWVGIELALGLATGTPVLDRFPTKACTVCWMEEEDGPLRMKRRFRRSAHGRGGPLPEPGRLWISVRKGLSLTTEAGLARLRTELRDIRPDVVFFVNLREVTGGRNMSKEEDAGAVRDTLRGLVREFGCDFVLVHHYRKAQEGQDKRGTQMLTGSGVWGAWAEAWLFLEPLDPEAKTVMVTAGCKDAEGMGRFLVTRADTADGEGVTLTYGEAAGAGHHQTARRDETRTRILAAVTAKPGSTVMDLVGALKAIGKPMTDRTVRDHLKALKAAGEVLGRQETSKQPERFWVKSAEAQGDLLGKIGNF